MRNTKREKDIIESIEGKDYSQNISVISGINLFLLWVKWHGPDYVAALDFAKTQFKTLEDVNEFIEVLIQIKPKLEEAYIDSINWSC